MTNLFVVAILLTAAAPAVEIETVDGKPVTGTLLDLSAQGVKLSTAQGPVPIEFAKLTGITPKVPPSAGAATAGVWLELVDGSSLVGSAYTAADGRARITVAGGGVLEVPTRDIQWVRLQPQSEAVAAQWSRIRGAEPKGDLLIVKKGDTLDYHSGVLRNVTDQSVQFELEGEMLPVGRGKVHGLAYRHPAGRELPEAVCSVTEASGSVWSVQSIATAGENLQWTTVTGLKVTRPLAAVKRIDFSRGKIVYLSDLEPESVSWTPYVGLGKEFPARAEFYAPRRDRSRDAGPLQLDGKTYAKGLALSSRTLVVYRLPSRYSRLTATVGIDDRVRPRGHVRLVIRGDDRVLLETAVAGAEPAKPIGLDVTGVRRLSVLVDFGEDLDIADYLDLCDARLVK